ncbi:MAG: tRNA (5-methylaminomethyl-2-thiouridine)(34)-methyltransferase MnmD [Bacteroidota bacterium]
MNRHTIQKTEDGTFTLVDERIGETFHSTHGALTESLHIFINAGLLALPKDLKTISVFEIGFGTGLNAWLTAIVAIENKIQVEYVSVDAFPVASETLSQINFADMYKNEFSDLYLQIIQSNWETENRIHPFFRLKKRESSFQEWSEKSLYDLIYYDAFSPDKQPELWTLECFQKCYQMLNPGGLLLTYSAKGSVKRALRDAGFRVENLPGPPGKREITKAIKKSFTTDNTDGH